MHILLLSKLNIDRVAAMSSVSTSPYGPVTSSGTVTSYLPLTTAWSAPAQCSSLFLESGGNLLLNAPEYQNDVAGAPGCMPPQISPWWYQSLNAASPTVTLLGGYDFLCPEAYTTAFSWAVDSTTTIGCCPSYVADLMTHNPRCCPYANSGNIALIATRAHGGCMATPGNASPPFLPGPSPTSSLIQGVFTQLQANPYQHPLSYGEYKSMVIYSKGPKQTPLQL